MKLLSAALMFLPALPVAVGDEVVDKLKTLDRLTVPHPTSLTADSIRPENIERTRAWVDVLGMVGFTHTSGSTCAAAMTISQDLDVPVCMFVVMRVDFESFERVLWHWDILKQRKAQGVNPSLIFFHWEGRGATQGLVWVWREMFRALWPDAKVAWYHYPGWSMAWSGSGESQVYAGLVVPADIGVHNAYGQDAAHNSMCRKETSNLMQERHGHRKVMPVLHWGITYGSVVGPEKRGKWTATRSLRRSPGASWNIARHYSVFAARGEVTHVMFWRFWTNIDSCFDEFLAYHSGWFNQPIEEKPNAPRQIDPGGLDRDPRLQPALPTGIRGRGSGGS
jgi:hypothetical protein